MTNEHLLSYGNHVIPYRIVADPTRTKRVAIHVDPDGSVTVDAPPGEGIESVAKAVQRRARWIVNHVEGARERFRHVGPREYVSGEQVLYLGRRYALKVIQTPGDPGSVKLRANRLEVRLAKSSRAKVKVLTRLWYRDRATDYFARRLSALSSRLPWVNEPPQFRLLEMTRQWGSCSSDGQVILNPHLVKAPRDGIDYVLIHEMAHLRHHDHGPGFRELIDAHCPGWAETKRRLDGLVEVVLAE